MRCLPGAYGSCVAVRVCISPATLRTTSPHLRWNAASAFSCNGTLPLFIDFAPSRVPHLWTGMIAPPPHPHLHTTAHHHLLPPTHHCHAPAPPPLAPHHCPTLLHKIRLHTAGAVMARAWCGIKWVDKFLHASVRYFVTHVRDTSLPWPLSA